MEIVPKLSSVGTDSAPWDTPGLRDSEMILTKAVENDMATSKLASAGGSDPPSGYNGSPMLAPQSISLFSVFSLKNA